MKRVYLFSLCLLVATMVAAYSGLVGDFSLDSLKEVIAPQAVEKVAEEAKKPEPDANLEFQDFTLRIIHNNDGESRIVSETIDGKVVGGAAEFKTAVDSLKATGVSNITLSSGDNFLAGKNFAASLNRADGLPFYDVEVLEAIGYDAICIGNHDFDFGPDVLADFINDFTVNTPPYLSANLDFSGEANLQTLVDADRIAPRTIVDVDGEQVGVIGLITESIGNISSPGNVQVDFTLVATAQAQIDSLTNAGVNKIILITHLQSIENELDLIAQIQGVDVVIAGGGDELLTNDPSIALDDQSVFGEYPLPATDVNGDTVYVVTTPGNYRYVGNLTVHFDDAGNVTEIVDGSDLILIEGFAADSALQASVTDSIVAANAALASNIIATSEVDLDGVRGNVRTIETNQGNLITDAFLWLAERERDARGLDPNLPIVSMQGGGGIRNDNVIPAGDFSEVFTFDMLPFSNTVVVLDPITPTQFKTVLENSVSSIPGASGRFSQVAGCEIVYNPFGDPQTTNEQDEIVLFDGDRIISATLADGTEIIKDGEVVDGAPNIYIVTNSFTAAGGDEYYVFDGLTSTQIAPSYQRALFDFIVDPTGLNGVITAAQYPEGGESRIAKESIVIEDSDKTFDLFPIGTFQTGIFDESAAEIVAYDAGSQRAFFTNADKNSVSIISISNPTKPRQIADIDMSVYGAGVNSVAVYDGLVAVAVEAEAVDANGSVVFFDTDGAYINDVEAGVLPDMLIFTPDGTRVLTANEGQPDDDYTIDPEGSVSIIDVANGADSAKVVNINFQSLNGTEDSLRAQGIRIFGPGASAAQDFEPEYVTITEDGSTAYVILQENNAIAVIDLETSTLSGVVPLGFKDHSADGNGFDASNRSELIDIRPRPTFG
ncbi:MAG: 5'-nucleotidase C-terminal domain-containing protein, partial [Bacteroidota bacterium]